MGAYCIETGKWWRVEFDESVQTRLRSVEERRDFYQRARATWHGSYSMGIRDTGKGPTPVQRGKLIDEGRQHVRHPLDLPLQRG